MGGITTAGLSICAAALIGSYSGIFNEDIWDFNDLNQWIPFTAYGIGDRVYAPIGSSVSEKVIECNTVHISSAGADFEDDYLNFWTLIETGV